MRSQEISAHHAAGVWVPQQTHVYEPSAAAKWQVRVGQKATTAKGYASSNRSKQTEHR